jgi:hypothetical protein
VSKKAPKKCERCERLLRRLRAQEEGDRMADETMREHLRMAQEEARSAAAALSRHADEALLSVAEALAFDCGMDWKDIRREYEDIEERGRTTTCDKIVALVKFLARRPELNDAPPPGKGRS